MGFLFLAGAYIFGYAMIFDVFHTFPIFFIFGIITALIDVIMGLYYTITIIKT